MIRLNSILILMMLLISACSFSPEIPDSSGLGGAYYQDDGPPVKETSDVEDVVDAIPREEPKSRYGNSPYTVFGKRYYPIQSAEGYREIGEASWYGKKFHGRKTSSGEVYDMYGVTAAHKTLPLNTVVRVTNLENSRSIILRINDRGPYVGNRILDCSMGAAKKLGFYTAGTAMVKIEVIEFGDNEYMHH